MNAKKMLVSLHHDLMYLTKSSMHNLRRIVWGGGRHIENSRQLLMCVSEKPSGYYEWAENKPTDPSVDLSVILPVYMVEQYIEQCLNSIIKQETSYTYEIICVNDGSMDHSRDKVLEIIKSYPNRRIRLIDQENRGVSGARNRGIDESIGKYLMFVDPDDYLLEGAIQTLMDEATMGEYEIVCGGFRYFSADRSVTYLNQPFSRNGIPQPEIYGYPCYIWGKVYKRKVWNDIRMPEGYLYEDMVSNFIIHRRCTSYSYLPVCIYAYRRNPNGASLGITNNPKVVDQYWMTEFIHDEYQRLGLTYDEHFKRGMLREWSTFLYNRTRKLDESSRKIVFGCACQASGNLDYDSLELSVSEKRALKALRNKDFYQWCISAQYWY